MAQSPFTFLMQGGLHLSTPKIAVRPGTLLACQNYESSEGGYRRVDGFERLDKSALEYVMKCRYVAGKVAGVPQAMWYEAPVNYVLE